MSSKEEKKAEKAVKSAHKKEKKRKAMEALENGEAQEEPTSPSAEISITADDEEERKRAKKQRKAEKKRAKAEAEAEAGAESSEKSAEKAAKKARKEAKKAKSAEESAPVQEAVTSTPIASTSKSTNAAAARAYMETNNVTIEAPEESNEKPPLPMLSFDELEGKIDNRLKKELDSNKFSKPTPIQACCWSVLLANKDVVGIAETGSGKTMAFGLPAMQHILQLPASENGQQKKGKGKYGKGGQNVSVLVIAPTR